MSRHDGRSYDQARPVTVELGAAPYAEGSCIIATGSTRVLCTASVEESVPGWRKGSGKGWVTAEYSMLPRATHTRTSRERGNLGGRTQEIQRLIGRSLRGAIDLQALGERTIRIDCDVLQADGGTRTASITGGCIALMQACNWIVGKGLLESSPLIGRVAAISVGIVDGEVCLDLDYAEDSTAEVDLNVVGVESGGLIEVQGTAERAPFSPDQLAEMVRFAQKGIDDLLELQLAL